LIVLASTSASRRRLLTQAGLDFKTAKPPVDEEEIKAEMKKTPAIAGDVAEALAEAKANGVAAILPGAYVIGADQMLDCEGLWFDKPADRAGARRHLETLRGKTHQLITAAVISHEGRIVWRWRETARMTMRDFSDHFLDHYMDEAGDGIACSVGAYELEGLGAQLFDKIEGDFFSILGLPLIPLLGGLRETGALAT
jgi:septum formation protein